MNPHDPRCPLNLFECKAKGLVATVTGGNAGHAEGLARGQFATQLRCLSEDVGEITVKQLTTSEDAPSEG